MKRPPDRQRYVPSGRLDAVPFVVASAIALGVALLAAFVVHLSTSLTFPSAIFAPLLAGAPVSGFVAIAVRAGRVRSPGVGALLGLVAGLFIFLGVFQFEIAAAKGNDHFLRVDLLPEWIDNHVRDTDLWNPQFARPNAPKPPVQVGELVFRWSVLGFGCAVGCIIPMIVGWLMGAKPFNEEHGRWLKAWPIRVTRESGLAVSEAVYWRDTEKLREAIKPIPVGETVNPEAGFGQLTVEYLPGEPGTPVYLSVAVMTVQRGKPPWPQTMLGRWELMPEEAAALADSVPIPNAAFGTKREGTSPGDRVATAIGAKIIPLPDQDAGLVLSSGNLWVATMVGLFPLALGLAGAGAAAAVAVIYYDDLNEVELGLVIAGGVAAFVASMVWMVLYADYLPARVFHAQARRVIAHRPDPFVYPDDPDAFFIQVIPRQNWSRVMLENADEVGFMRLDATRGIILYEGDHERWMIPRESVVSCELEAFDIGPSDPSVGPAFWLVVLRANVDGRVWEAPFTLRPITLVKLTPTTRRRDAELLQSWIRNVLKSRSS